MPVAETLRVGQALLGIICTLATLAISAMFGFVLNISVNVAEIKGMVTTNQVIASRVDAELADRADWMDTAKADLAVLKSYHQSKKESEE